MDDDYYDLLGVAPDAPVDDIRAAYRERKAALASGDSKGEAAALNKAWNVLSDPFQRDRYDRGRADAAPAGDDADDDDVEEGARVPARARRTRGADARDAGRARRAPRAPLPPTVTLPPGTEFPRVRQRLTAMGVDILVLIALFFASQVLLVSLEKSQHRTAYDAVTALNKTKIPDAQKVQDTASKNLSAVQKAKGKTSPDATAAQHALDDAKAKVKALNDQLNRESKVLAPLQNLVTVLFFLAVLLVLVVPSLFGGQTLGKRTQRVRVIGVNGSRARASALLVRYGSLVFAGLLATFLFRSPIGAVLVLAAASMWTRNPNQQGLQDRFAKTLVVTDSR